MTITIPRPFDGHVHFRNGDLLKAVGPYTWGYASGAIIMPNTNPTKITDTARALGYLDEIRAAMSTSAVSAQGFTPYLTCYLTDKTDPNNVLQGFDAGIWKAVKSYPLGGTTNSDEGTSNWEHVHDVLVAMEKHGISLLIHGETPNFSTDLFNQPGKKFRILKENPGADDVYDRERLFLEKTLYYIRRQYPKLKIVLEHITTAEAAHFVESYDNTWATVTPQHAIFDRNDMAGRKFRGELFCMPILKTARDRFAIQAAITGKHAHKFRAGTDTAPHLSGTKYCAECCAGCFNAIEAPSIYAELFDLLVGLGSPEGAKLFTDFMSNNLLRDVYGIQPSQRQMRFTNEVPLHVPDKVLVGVPSGYTLTGPEEISTWPRVIPMLAGQNLEWSWSHVVE